MKKVLEGFLKIIFMIVFAFSLTPSKEALAKEFRVDKYDAFYEILPNGDVKVEERIMYYFDGSYNGMLREIDYGGTSGVEDLKVFLLKGDEEVKIDKENYGGNTAEYYSSSDYSNLLKLRVYSKSNYEYKTLILKYTLKDAVVKYNDIGLFNRFVVDRNNSIDLKLVEITLKAPVGNSDKSNLHIFTRGDLLGYDEILDESTVKINIGNAERYKGIETQFIFPANLIPEASKVENVNKYEDLLSLWQKDAQIANANRDKAKINVAKAKEQIEWERKKIELGKKITSVSWVTGALSIIGAIAAFLKYGKKPETKFQGDYYRELPADYTPAVMSYLMFSKNISSRDIMATLLDLARKKIIRIIPSSRETQSFFGGSKNEDDFIIESMLETDKLGSLGLRQHEINLYKWFINDLGINGQISLGEIKENMKKKSFALGFANKFNNFQSLAKIEGRKENFFGSTETPGIGKFFLIPLVSIAFGVLMVVYLKNLFGIAAIIGGALGFFALLALILGEVKTEKGREDYAKWSAFKKFLLDFSNLNRSEIPALTLWNHYLVYATSLGIAKEVIEQLPKVFSAEEIASFTDTRGGYNPVFYNYNTFSSFDRTINSSVKQAMDVKRQTEIANSARSSSSGSGGGFSGGSGGGSGGGGSIGAF